jgi:hypothetical protein
LHGTANVLIVIFFIDFQKQYDILLADMKTYYTNLKKKGSIREADLKNNEIFVVYVEREDMYYRVQVIEMSLEQVFMFFKNCKSFVI